ncbi:FAD-dependent oxidoreductase [Telmatospirillum sp.]|uniref:NAD(P)/FAD-dependent oxidoreductase n=1 Tax=Telmatospirillum sp. TaxID=2079197 RepID=UPI00283D3C9B|nr:FAD-dependent oxidoreductase [Telmatospirillum sp.]MDR3440443.1 FAD-dependent oxidoreductase [Telmatospirillum sp.]
MTTTGVVIVGSGLAGYTLVREFRKLDRATPVTVVTADDGQVYSKPMLSNAFAQGKDARTLVQKTADQFADEMAVSILTRHQVESIDRSAGLLHLRQSDLGTRTLPYRQLVLAVGADPRPYRITGGYEARIRTVNDLDDYGRWRDALPNHGRVLLIGAGLIGSEFANDLAAAGHRVAMVEPASWPLGRLLPEAVGAELASAVRQAGVTLHLGRTVARMSPGKAVLDDGTGVDFDCALSAIGLLARTDLAARAGLAVGRGILVDRLLRTSDPDIFALGDCAETGAGPLPFVLPLMAEARALAATLAGHDCPLVLPALPVVVKTPCLPVVVCPPPASRDGRWSLEGEGRDRKALFLDGNDRPIGFALSGARTSERQALAKGMPFVLG